MTQSKQFLAGTLAAAALAATAAHGASILGQTFNVDVSVDGAPAVSFPGTAGAGVPNAGGVVSPFQFEVVWVDADSFNLTISADPEAFGASELQSATISLTGLQFKTPSLQNTPIIGASFNPNENGYLGYFFDPVNNDSAPPRPADPLVSFTANSVTITYANFPELAVGDQIPQRFDVQTAVPEPSTSAALLAMVGGVGLLRRHLRKAKAE